MTPEEQKIIAAYQKYLSEGHKSVPPASILVPYLQIMQKKNMVSTETKRS